MQTPQQLRNEALSWLLGEYKPAELVAWADSWIERLDSWPDELTEISLWGMKRDSRLTQWLEALATGGAELEAVKLLLEREYAKFRQENNPYRLSSVLYPLTYSPLSDNSTYDDLVTALHRLDYWVNEVFYSSEQERATDTVMKDNIIREFCQEFGALPAPFTFKP